MQIDVGNYVLQLKRLCLAPEFIDFTSPSFNQQLAILCQPTTIIFPFSFLYSA